eukprot:GEMP01041952.1.p1 GENE.GEMP01041952.1~~GEMP01041952.1.p1  ORF type:complete len:467 (+),score=86.51 GEMP01041952.1:133-1533(+)
MTDLHAEDESFLETHARWPCAQLFASCPKSGILFLFARVLFFWPTTIPIIVSAHVADVAPHGCLDALKAWHFPSPDDVTTIVLLPYLPTAQSRTCTRLQDRFRAVNRTATECTLGVNRPAPGRVIEFTLGYVNVDGAMDGLNSMACVPRHECTDEEDIGAALVQLIPYATHARVQFLTLWEDVDIDWIIVGLYKQGSTALARHLSLHPELDLVWNTPNVFENNIFLDSSRLLPLQRQVDNFRHAVAPSVDRRCHMGGEAWHDGRHCLARNSTRSNNASNVPQKVSRGIKMFSPHPSQSGVDNILLNAKNRFLWTEVFPNLAVKIVVSVTDPVHCFYSSYYWLPSTSISLHACILQVHRLGTAPGDRARVEDARGSAEEEELLVRMGDLNTASYNRLVRWASNGKATVPFAPDINARYNPSPNTSRWIVRDGTRYPSEVSYEVHQVLRNSFASEYVDIEPWLSAYAP